MTQDGPRRRWSVRAAAVAAAFGLALVPWLPAAADDTAFTIADPRIAESSGLAADPAAGVLWTVNDGKAKQVFALTDAGGVQAVVKFGGQAQDVEALARVGERLYIGDIGDNTRKRQQITVYSLLNPKAANATVGYRAWDFRYPDGKAHDAEALLISTTGQVFVITKEKKGGIYSFDGSPSPQGVNQLKKVGNAPAYVTDGTFLADGRMVLRSYVGLFVLDSKYKIVAQAPLPVQPQGETITTTLDGAELLVGSEGKGSAVLQIPIPASTEQVPAGGASPPVPAEAEEDTQDTAADSDRSGTLRAVGVAAGVAVLAALITALIGRRRRPARRAAATPDGDDQGEDSGDGDRG